MVAPVPSEMTGPIVMAEAVVAIITVMVSITVTITIHIIIMTVMSHMTGSRSGMVETASKTAHARSNVMAPVAEHGLKLAPPALKISGRMGETTTMMVSVSVSVSVIIVVVVMVSVSVIIVMVSVSVIMVIVSVIMMVPMIIAIVDNTGMDYIGRMDGTIDVRNRGAAAFAAFARYF